MRKIINLYKKYKEIINYLITGILTTLISISSYFILSIILDIDNNIYFIAANIISWICAIIFAYVTNKKFVFTSITENTKDTLKEFSLFAISRIATLLIELIFMFISVKILLINDKFAKVIAQIIIIILNYIISKIFVFKSIK